MVQITGEQEPKQPEEVVIVAAGEFSAAFRPKDSDLGQSVVDALVRADETQEIQEMLTGPYPEVAILKFGDSPVLEGIMSEINSGSLVITRGDSHAS